MTNPDSPLNLHPSHAQTPYDYDKLAKADTGTLEPAEAEALAYWRSEASLRDYNPATAAPEDISVETVDHGSTTLGALAANEDLEPNLRQDAVDRMETIRGNEAATEPAPAASTTPKSSDSSKGN